MLSVAVVVVEIMLKWFELHVLALTEVLLDAMVKAKCQYFVLSNFEIL